MTTPRARLQDVARVAGVSMTTASHTFSGRRPVSAESRAAVLKAAFDLGFVGDRTERAHRVGLLIRPPETTAGFAAGTASMATMAGAVLVALLGAGYSVSSFRSLQEIGDQIGRLDAFVLLHPNWNDDALRELVRRGIPTVTTDPDPGDQSFQWWVGPDYSASAVKMLDHLVSRGSRRTALIIGSTRNMWSVATLDAYLRFSRRRNDVPLIRELDSTAGEVQGYRAAASLLAPVEAPDTILTTGGLMAVGALRAIRERRSSCPEDCMVAAMMDGIAVERAVVPITAMRPDYHGSALLVVDQLGRRLRDEPPLAQNRTELDLVMRGSTDR